MRRTKLSQNKSELLGVGIIAALGSMPFLLTVGLFIGWVMNLVALTRCDFEPAYKAEVIRSIGVLVPPVGGIAGWVTIEDGVKVGVETE